MTHRSVSLFACLVLAGMIRPAAAQFVSPAQTQAFACIDEYNARSYRQSLQNCAAAATGFERQTQMGQNPWYGFYMQARMLYMGALDYAGLRNHRNALQEALRAHQVTLYVLRNYQIPGSERNDLIALTYNLQRLEASQQNGTTSRP